MCFGGPVLGCVTLSPSPSLILQDHVGALEQSRPESWGWGGAKLGSAAKALILLATTPSPLHPGSQYMAQITGCEAAFHAAWLVRMGVGSSPAQGREGV